MKYFVNQLTFVVLLASAVSLLIVVASYLTVSEPNEIVDASLLADESFSEAANFSDVSLQQNLLHSHVQHTGEISDLVDVVSAGVCADDFDNDGWIDLLFTGGGGLTRFYGDKSWWQSHKNIQLYANRSGVFERIQDSGLLVSGSTTSCASADFNRDGLVDLIITTTNEDYLFQNMGALSFSRIVPFSQIAYPMWTSSVAIADFDNDGDPDIHLSHFLRYQKNQKSLENATGFSEQHQRQFDPKSFDGLPNQILVNNGNFVFEDATERLNLDNLSERTVSANWHDFDQDNRPDLIVLNRSDQPIRVFLNKAEGFKPIVDENWILQANNSHSFAQGQEINDPYNFSIVTRPSGLASLVASYQNPLLPMDISWQSNLVNHQHIYLNFWGTFFADFNNDGFTDVTLASGGYQLDPFAHKMTIPSANICASQTHKTVLSDSPVFTVNECVSGGKSSSRGAVRLDFNNDGKIDILYANNNDFPQLLENQSTSKGNWITLSLPPENRYNYSKVNLSAGNKSITRGMSTNIALYGQHDPRWHFGLSQHTDAEVTVFDKTGQALSTQTLAANGIYQFENNRWIRSKDPLPVVTAETNNELSISDMIRFSLGSGIPTMVWQKLNDIHQPMTINQSTELATIVEKAPNIQHLALYHRLLDTPEQALVVASIKAIRNIEHESSLGDLLYRLDSADAVLYCAIADTFAHWFQEEEAVVRGKYKAVPHLIRRLGDKDPKVVACSANALGHSEHTNAASAIIASFYESPIESRPELAKALGNIRQGEAIPLLRSLLTESSNIQILQQAIIALTRLADPELDKHIIDAIKEIQQGDLLLLAIATMDKAEDAVVVSVENRYKWLLVRDTINANFNQLPNKSTRIAYLQVAEDYRFLIPSLVELSRNSSYPLFVFAAKQKLRIGTLTKPEINILLSLKLDSELIKLLINSPKNIAEVEGIEKFNIKQLSNLVNLFSALSNQQLDELFATISQRDQVQQDILLPVSIFRQCASLNDSRLARFNERNALPKPLISILTLCKVAANDKTYSLAQIANSLNTVHADDFSTRPMLSLVSDLIAILELNQSRKLSAALLFQSKISTELKTRWALNDFVGDRYKQNWLSTRLIKDEGLFSELLAREGGFSLAMEVLQKNKADPESLYSEKTIQRLNSFAHLDNFLSNQ